MSPAYHDYDNLEYTGIWAITIVMTVFGMTAALIAGVIAALSVYAALSITRSNPIREILSAKTLRSSVWTRPAAELAILNDDKSGRSRILVIQLHGHVSFVCYACIARMGLLPGTQHEAVFVRISTAVFWECQSVN